MGSAPAMVKICGLTKAFGGRAILRGIDLEVPSGQFLVIFGPNEAGKTTLLRILATLIRPTAGQVFIAGRDIAASAPQLRRYIGFVSHQPLLYGELSAVENLRFYGLLYDVPALERRIGEVLQLMRLNHCQDAPVRTLSRGMQQRLALARAFLHNPPLLLLDEPFTGLDQHASATLIEFLQTMHDGSRTIVLTTHNLEQGLALGDRVALLVGGRIVYQAEKEALEAGDFREAYLRYAESEL